LKAAFLKIAKQYGRGGMSTARKSRKQSYNKQIEHEQQAQAL
jgi:hypothetical protein